MIKSALRRLKLTYVLNNLVNREHLQHNVELYKKYGLSKKFYSSISTKDFKHLKDEHVVSDKGRLSRIAVLNSENSKEESKAINFETEGYLMLRGFLDSDMVQRVNEEVREAEKKGRLTFRYGTRKAVNTHFNVNSVKELSRDPRLVEIVESLLSSEVEVLQSINFPNMGSEQRPHTDALHFSTYPKGGMVGVWIALEKIDDQNGAISYYPGSHKLPYLMNDSYGNEGNSLLIGNKPYSAYEDMIEAKIKELGLKEEKFSAQPGDVMIWHANLIHAGSKHLDTSRTRKSLVMHYNSKSCIWYHEISQRPVIAKAY